MHTMQRAMTAYGQAAETLAPARQVVLLYDGAIRRIGEARRAIEERRANQRHVAVAKATAIVDALATCLDHERGGEIALNLDRIYSYVSFRLQWINIADDVAVCDELIERLAELRDAWARLAEGDGASQPAAGPAAEANLTVTA